IRDFLNKKNIINLLLLGIMVLAIPLTVRLVRQQQILFSQAAAARVEFLTQDSGGTNCVVNRGGNKVAVCNDLRVRFTAPTGEDIRFAGRTTLLPQQGLVSKVYAVDPVQPGQCAGDDWYRPENGDPMVSCSAQGQRCVPGQGCTSQGVCQGNWYLRGSDASRDDNWEDCGAQGKQCVNGQGCVARDPRICS